MTTTEPLTLFPGNTGNLTDRTQIFVTGEDAGTLLQSILTADLNSLPIGILREATLLTPQGKIMFDLLISRIENGFRIDIALELAEAFSKRLMLYRLRAKVEINVIDESVIRLSWHDDSSAENSTIANKSNEFNVKDERFPVRLNVYRHYASEGQAPDATVEELRNWTALRIANGIAAGGEDYIMSDVFPHDINLEQLKGVSFTKGCFIGQEVVSRMQHRGTARRRLLIAKSTAPMPPRDTPITADGKEVGRLGSVSDNMALALVRIDRVRDALAQSVALLAGDTEITLSVPDYASFSLTEATGEN